MLVDAEGSFQIAWVSLIVIGAQNVAPLAVDFTVGGKDLDAHYYTMGSVMIGAGLLAYWLLPQEIDARRNFAIQDTTTYSTAMFNNKRSKMAFGAFIALCISSMQAFLNLGRQLIIVMHEPAEKVGFVNLGLRVGLFTGILMVMMFFSLGAPRTFVMSGLFVGSFGLFLAGNNDVSLMFFGLMFFGIGSDFLQLNVYNEIRDSAAEHLGMVAIGNGPVADYTVGFTQMCISSAPVLSNWLGALFELMFGFDYGLNLDLCAITLLGLAITYSVMRKNERRQQQQATEPKVCDRCNLPINSSIQSA